MRQGVLIIGAEQTLNKGEAEDNEDVLAPGERLGGGEDGGGGGQSSVDR